MAYFQPPQERPRHVKRFVTVRDIEDAATDGCLELIHAEDMVITDAAREAAHDLGVKIVKPDPGKQPAAAPAAMPVSAARSAPPPFTSTLYGAAREAAPAPLAPSAPYAPGPAAPHAPGTPGAASPAFMPPSRFSADGHPLIQELAQTIRARWRPVQRRQRQLLA